LGVGRDGPLRKCRDDGVAGAHTRIRRRLYLNAQPIDFNDEPLCPTKWSEECRDLSTNLASRHQGRCTISRRDGWPKERYARTDEQNAKESRADKIVDSDMRASRQQRQHDECDERKGRCASA
jgi:hypothetical protein